MSARYQIIANKDMAKFEKAVNDALISGYELAGMMFHSDGVFYQPMAKLNATEALAVKKK